MSEPSPSEDRDRLQWDMGFLMEFLESLWQMNSFTAVRDEVAHSENPAGVMVLECVMARVRQRLRDGFWDDNWYEEWLKGEA